MTILAGTTPGFLGTVLPEEAWTMGTTSRLLMVFTAQGVTIDPLKKRQDFNEHRARLVRDLLEMTKVAGAFTVEERAAIALRAWHTGGCMPKPEHAKLLHYITRRITSVMKLAMIASMSRSTDLVIRLQDIDRAKSWLLEAERSMPDIFTDMFKHSDSTAILDTHFFLWREYTRNRRPIHEKRIYDQLWGKVSVDKIPKIIEVMVKSDMLIRYAGEIPMYVPRPLGRYDINELDQTA
jgi:hypothetical protein